MEVPSVQINISIPLSAAFTLCDDVTPPSARLGAECISPPVGINTFNPPARLNHLVIAFFRGYLSYTWQDARFAFTLTDAVSLPQVGTFTTQHGEYFLEPLLNAGGEEYDEQHNKPHLVYRHERHRDASNATVPCAASGNKRRLTLLPVTTVCLARAHLRQPLQINVALKCKLHPVTTAGSCGDFGLDWGLFCANAITENATLAPRYAYFLLGRSSGGPKE